MNRCEKCGQLIGKNKEHKCPEKVWNKGIKMNKSSWNKGKNWNENTKKKMSLARKGKDPWNKGKKGLQIAWNKGLHINLNPEGSFKKGQTYGEKNVNWKGGITSKREKERKETEVKKWKKLVFERDNYTCHKYGIRTGGLVVHHILNFSEYPELRTELSNGITLSKKAHKEFHDKYGYKNNTKEQLEEFLGKSINL